MRSTRISPAQYVCVKNEFVALKPKNLSFVAGKAGQTVLIAGASGGVGTLAVQIAAKAFAARVVATAGTANLEYVRKLGAADVVDYAKGDVVTQWPARASTWATARPIPDPVPVTSTVFFSLTAVTISRRTRGFFPVLDPTLGMRRRR